MTAMVLERPMTSADLMEPVLQERQKTEAALITLNHDESFNRRILRSAGIPEAVLERLRYDEDADVLEAILLMRWDAYKQGIEQSLGPAAKMLPLEIE